MALAIDSLISALGKYNTNINNDSASNASNANTLEKFMNVLENNKEPFAVANNVLTTDTQKLEEERKKQDEELGIAPIKATESTTSTTPTIPAVPAKAEDTVKTEAADATKTEDNIMDKFKWVLIGIGIFVFLIVVIGIIYYYLFSAPSVPSAPSDPSDPSVPSDPQVASIASSSSANINADYGFNKADSAIEQPYMKSESLYMSPFSMFSKKDNDQDLINERESQKEQQRILEQQQAQQQAEQEQIAIAERESQKEQQRISEQKLQQEQQAQQEQQQAQQEQQEQQEQQVPEQQQPQGEKELAVQKIVNQKEGGKPGGKPKRVYKKKK